jgi:hypothetical protein
MLFRQKTLTALLIFGTCFAAAIITAPASMAKGKGGSFVPALSIVPNVFEPDGLTLRTYRTGEGQTFWSPNLPVEHGDKITLKIFATTGGADLDKVIVRLDNVKIAELAAAPWSATIDTEPLQQGSHMVEVWAEATGSPAQSTTKTFAFVVAAPQAQQAAMTTQGSAVVEPDMPGGDGSTGSQGPSLPKFLAKKAINESAGVMLRSQDADVDRLLTTDNGSVLISSPAIIYCERSPGSQAVNFAYALTRADSTIVSSTKPGSLEYVKIRLQPLADNKTGLLPGKVTLWVWGIDKTGRPSNPGHRDFVIASTGQ